MSNTDHFEKNVVVIVDIDKTLLSHNMQDPILDDFEVDKNVYWEKVSRNDMESPKTFTENYVDALFECVDQGLSKDYLASIGERCEYYPGGRDFMSKLRERGKEKGINFDFYVVSTGIKTIIENLPNYDDFKQVFASELEYKNGGVEGGVKFAMEPYKKTKYFDKIAEIEGVKPENMIYIGDGLTDNYVFDHMADKGGHSICVYDKKQQPMGDVQLEADYVKTIPDHIMDYVGEVCL